jgi:23S rRNA (pseudouridine1915-N3)-methyltransferase
MLKWEKGENAMKITVLAVGKVKEKFYRDAIGEFQKRLGRYCRLEIVEVADEQTPDHASGATERQIKVQEGRRLLKKIREGDWVCALAIEGKMLDSVGFSQKINALGVGGASRLVFVVGGSLGLSEEVLGRADFLLSFSEMTFPHQLMRVILLEQIYRAYRIMKHEPYHK